MTLKEFSKSHNKKIKDVIEILKANIDKINDDDDHVKFNNEWLLDDVAVNFLENIFTKEDEFGFPEPDFLKKSSEHDVLQKNFSEIDELKKQITDLKNSLQFAKETAATKDEEFKKLQERILNYEDGATSINGDLIRKYQNKSERLEKELLQTQSDLIKLHFI